MKRMLVAFEGDDGEIIDVVHADVNALSPWSIGRLHGTFQRENALVGVGLCSLSQIL